MKKIDWTKPVGIETLNDRDGRPLRVGDPVVASNEEGMVCEGNVFLLLPWGAEWFDASWKRGTVVIEDHESKQRSNWNPDNVEYVGK